MITPIAITSSELLKNIHITKLQVIVFVNMVSEAQEKPVLIKIIINYLLSEIYMHFIIYNK